MLRRLAGGWVLTCGLILGGVSGGMHVRHQRQQTARIAAERQAGQQRLAVRQHALEEEDLLAKVDSDVSRQVPSAMEPLARLMDDGEVQ